MVTRDDLTVQERNERGVLIGGWRYATADELEPIHREWLRERLGVDVETLRYCVLWHDHGLVDPLLELARSVLALLDEEAT